MPELVVIAEQLLAPVPGGTGRYTAELLRALAETAPPGWRVSSVTAWHRDVRPARIPGVAGPRRLPLPARGLIAGWQLGLPLWPGGDALHAPTPLAPARVPRGRTLSVTVHDTVPWTHPETLTPRGVAWHRAAIQRAAKIAGTLLVPTAAVRAELAEYLPAGTDIQVVPHGRSTALRASGGQAPTLPDRYVLALGTLEPRKGIDSLVAAVATLPDVPLVLVGQPGWGGFDPVAAAAAHGLAPERLVVFGRLPDARLARVLAGATVLAAPSLAEGFGLPVVEAMAAGVPVVHSDAPALVEVAGGAGISVPRGRVDQLAAALGSVLDSADRRRTMIAAGLSRASEFSWSTAATRIWAIHAGDGPSPG